MSPPAPRRRDPVARGRVPIYERLRQEYSGGPGIGRHRLTGHGGPTEEIPMARHYDVDGDGLADHGLVDQRDDHAHDDEACDQEQAQPDRWTGVTRDPDWLPVAPATVAGYETTWRGDRA